MKKIILPIFVFILTISSVFAQVNITFELNTATIAGNIDPAGLYIAGGSGFGSPGDNQLVDPDGDGIYTITLQRESGFSSHYIFLNGNCPDYNCKENIAGLPCSDPANFNDRFLPAVTSDITIKACFNTCDSDGTCTIVTDSVDITFNLNTESLDMVDPGGIFLAGGGNFGNPGDNPMIDPDGDGIYTITVKKPMGFASYYTFTNGNCPDYSCKEDLDGLPCGDPNSFNDRFLSPDMTMTDVTISACFGNCANDGSCIPSSVNGLEIDKTLFRLQPSIVHDFTEVIFGKNAISQEKQLVVMNAVGQVLHTIDVGNETNYRLNTTDYTNGLYFLSVVVEKRLLTKKFVVQK
jgi:hypothetical protein